MIYENELYHHGVKGQKWGVRRYRNPDGTLTAAGKKRRENRIRVAANAASSGVVSGVANALIGGPVLGAIGGVAGATSGAAAQAIANASPNMPRAGRILVNAGIAAATSGALGYVMFGPAGAITSAAMSAGATALTNAVGARNAMEFVGEVGKRYQD